MAYTPVPEHVTGYVVLAADWNTYIKDNFAASPAGVATAKGDMFIGTGANTMGVLGIGSTNQIVEADSAQAAGVKNSWAFVPIGGIIMWSGLIGAIPSNWQLCDGTNGTPNLRDKFIVGAGSTYAVGATGGADSPDLTHTHTFGTAAGGSHDHTRGATGAGSSHTHTLTTDANTSEGGTVAQTSGAVTATSHTHVATTVGETAHTHTSSANTDAATHLHGGTSGEGLGVTDIRPPYYAIAYIQRMS